MVVLIESALQRIAERLASRLPSDDLTRIREFLTVGEPGLALETLCSQLCEYELRLEKGDVAELRALARGYGLENKLRPELDMLESDAS